MVPAAMRASVSTSRSAPARGQARAQFERVFFRADLGFPFEQHVAGVEAGVDPHGGDAGVRFAVRDGPLDGRRAAIFGQQRSVDIDDAVRRDVEDRLRDDLAVADDDHRFGRDGAQLFDDFGAADALGLMDWEAEAQGGFL